MNRRQAVLFAEPDHHAYRAIVGEKYKPACPGCPALPWDFCKCWPTLESAVEQKIEQQAEFVQWWRDTVRGPGKANSRRTGGIGYDEAENITGITGQQVSRWAKRRGKKSFSQGSNGEVTETA